MLALGVADVRVPSRLTPARNDERIAAGGAGDPTAQAATLAERATKGYDELALALAPRARETAEPRFLRRRRTRRIASRCRLAPGRLRGLIGSRPGCSWASTSSRRRASARERSTGECPTTSCVYGMLVDANVELGRYDEAEEAAQWMLDLRPGNVAGLTRAAYLRELFGDVEGALELMAHGVDQVPPRRDRGARLDPHADRAPRSWSRAGVERAERLLDGALRAVPRLPLRAGGAGRSVRAAQGRSREAAALLRRALRGGAASREPLRPGRRRSPGPGADAEARRAFAEFEAAGARAR